MFHIYGNLCRNKPLLDPGKMSRDHSGRSKWSREQAQNSNAIDRFFQGANSDFGSSFNFDYIQIPCNVPHCSEYVNTHSIKL